MTDPARSKAVRLSWFAAFAAATLVTAYRAYAWVVVARGDLRGPDYFSFYAAARLFAARGGAHLYEGASQKQFQDQVTSAWAGHFILLPFLHPPYFALLISPLSLLSFHRGYAVMAAVSLLLLVGALLTITRAAGMGPGAALTTAALTTSFLPVFAVFIQGQSDMLILLPLCLAYLFWVRNRPGWAGFCAGLAIIKPQLLLLVPVLFLVQGCWRALAGYAAGAAGLVAASLPFFGIRGWTTYLKVVAPWLVAGNHDFPITGQTVYSLRGLLEGGPGGKPLAVGLLAALAAGAVAALAIRSGRPGLDLAFAVAASLVLSPYQNLHDLSLLVVPAVALAGFARQGALRHPRIGVAVLLLAYLAVDLIAALGPQLAALGATMLALYLGWERLPRGRGSYAAAPVMPAS